MQMRCGHDRSSDIKGLECSSERCPAPPIAVRWNLRRNSAAWLSWYKLPAHFVDVSSFSIVRSRPIWTTKAKLNPPTVKLTICTSQNIAHKKHNLTKNIVFKVRIFFLTWLQSELFWQPRAERPVWFFSLSSIYERPRPRARPSPGGALTNTNKKDPPPQTGVPPPSPPVRFSCRQG